jgi:hypothetical protein
MQTLSNRRFLIGRYKKTKQKKLWRQPKVGKNYKLTGRQERKSQRTHWKDIFGSVLALLPNMNTRWRFKFVGEITQVTFLNKIKFSHVDHIPKELHTNNKSSCCYSWALGSLQSGDNTSSIWSNVLTTGSGIRNWNTISYQKEYG